MRAGAAIAVLLTVASCAPQPIPSDRVRIFDLPGRPEKEWGYDPPSIRVASGTIVTFVNSGVVFHTVTSDGATRVFDVGVDPGASATIRFEKAGDWSYHCGVHPDMKGLVHVCDGACP